MKLIKFFLMIIFFEIKIKADNQIIITFNSPGNHFIYCDDIINYFETTNISIYRKLEDKRIKINKISLIHNNNDICQNKIYYYSETEYETIIIEFKIFPKNLHGLFRQSDINSIEINVDDNYCEVLDFSNMFQDCVKLTSIDLSNFNFCNVTKFNNMFSGCTNLRYFSFPKKIPLNCINFENIDFSEMFFNCVSLTSIDLSDMTFYGINNITNIFSNCYNIQSIKLKGEYFESDYNGLLVEIFPIDNNIRELNLFDLNMNLNYINLNNLNSLEECLYFKYYSNIKKCSKYIGFHYCGNCINLNIENYCTKIIDGEEFNFYYLEHQLNIPIEERECYWSNNFTNFLSYKFISDNKSYYTYNYEFCEKYLNNIQCIKCNNNNGFYKIENEDYQCSDKPPAENYVLDIEEKEWRQCNERCQKCYIQSKSEIDHQCISCNKYYYPFKIDYDNYRNNKITGFNCFSFAEVYSKYSNYFLNINNQFEKCDISCERCETKNECLNCSQNYYYIYGNENGTCFHEPKYGLTKINDNLYFIPCFKSCKYCNKVSQSLLNQQCTECDEIDYTLDIYSYNKYLCIPKDNSNLPSIKEKTKWYIDGDFNELNIANKGLTIDYEKLLNNENYYNLSYKIVEKCPENKPYIIYSIRQCVSSCKSSNLIENGIFMTKKLYLYNNICYHECPYGSIEDDINDICIEINNHTSINKSLTSNEFKENNELYILKYLTESANNTVEILRAYDFSNYFYNQNENYSHQLQLQMPIFNFTECIEKLKTEYNLFNNNFFYGIMEYNDQINKNEKYIDNLYLINSTSYQFFLENGTILNYGICEGLNITTEKRIEVNRINIDILNKVEEMFNISLFDNNNEIYNDYCTPFSIDNKDLTLYERQLLNEKYKHSCDDECTFQSFNYSTNYSTCICPIKVDNEEINIKDTILKKINEYEYINLLLYNSNYKYFICYKIFFSIILTKEKLQKLNWFIYISFSFIFLQLLFFIYFWFLICKPNLDDKETTKNDNNKINNKNDNKTLTNTNKSIQNNIINQLLIKNINVKNNINDIIDTKRISYSESRRKVKESLTSNKTKNNNDTQQIIYNKTDSIIQESINDSIDIRYSQLNLKDSRIIIKKNKKKNNGKKNKLNHNINNIVIYNNNKRIRINQRNKEENNKIFNTNNTINIEPKESSKNINNQLIGKNNELKQEENNNIIIEAIKDDFWKMNFREVQKKDNRGFCEIFCHNFFKGKCITLKIKCYKKFRIIYIVMFLISLHTFFFINTMLFTEKYIIERNTYKNKSEINFLITEYNRFIYTFIICIFFIRFLQKEINEIYKTTYKNEYELVQSLLIFNIFILVLHLIYGYFITIFGFINFHIQKRLCNSMVIYLITYFILYFFICFFISLTRFYSIKYKCKILFKLSNFIRNNIL